jgi:hypothetical protein
VVLFNLPETFSKDKAIVLLNAIGKITEIEIPRMPNG